MPEILQSLIGQEIGGYTIQSKIGSGGYGTVYLAVKEDLGKRYQTAIKYVVMPEPEYYEEVLQQFNYNKVLAENHFTKIVEDISSEINTLLDLNKKDNRYIVAYYDHAIRKTPDPLMFEIFIRMEYLVPLNKYIRSNGMTLADVIQLGMDIGEALVLCHSNGVMHRDIKEANIFVSESGHFKLGDFGVAKTLMTVTKAASMKGTASYMAPEIYQREPYDMTVDIYSLGIVLYRLLNNLRMPFLPDYPTPIRPEDIDWADTRRLKGEIPPLPFFARNALGEIILKACAVREMRFRNADELKELLAGFLATLTEDEKNRLVVSPAANNRDTRTPHTPNNPGTPIMNASNTPNTHSTTAPINSGSNAMYIPGASVPPTPGTSAPNTPGATAGVLGPAGANPFTEFAQNSANPNTSGLTESIGVRGHQNISPVNNQNPAIASPQPIPVKVKKPVSTGTKVKIILFSVLALAVAAGGYIGYLLLTNPLTSFKKSIESGDFVQAIAVYDKNIRGDAQKSKDVSTFIKSRAETVANDYLASTIEYDDALSRLQELENLQILSSAEIGPFLMQINEMRTSRSAYENAQRLISSNEFATAIVELRKVIQADGNYANAQTQLVNAVSSYKEAILTELASYDINKAYADAISKLNGALQVVPNDADILNKINDYHVKITAEQKARIDELIGEANKLVADSQAYEQAVATLTNALTQYPGNASLQAAIQNVTSDHIKHIVGQADALAIEKKYEDAIAVLESGASLYPGDATLEERMAGYREYLPEYLKNLNFLSETNGVENWDIAKNSDNLGNIYINGGLLFEYENARRTYFTNSKYSRFKGKIVLENYSKNESGISKIVVYSDGKVVYVSPGITQNVLPVKFDIDIAGCEQLSIELQDVSGWGIKLGVVDAAFYKE